MNSSLFLSLLLLLRPQEKQDPRVLVALEDGSRFTAKAGGDPIELRTGFGDLRVPLTEIRSLRRAGTEVLVRTTRLQVQGSLVRPDLAFDTDFGRLKVPAQDLTSIDPTRGTVSEVDDRTALFWCFEDVRNGQLVDLAGKRSVKISEGDVVEDPAGFRCFSRKNENGFVVGTLPEDFRFAEGAFTLEVRVKVGQITRGYATILACNDDANCHTRDFWFLAQASGQLYFDSGNAQKTNFVSQTSTAIDLRAWNYLAVVHDPKDGELRYYVNGKKAHTDKRAVQFNSSGGPILLGPGTSGKAYFSCPERFQFVRITKGVRSDEEIAEWQKLLETQPVFTTARIPARGIALRDGGFLRADLPAMSGAKFRTRFGTLEITAEIKGRIEIYPVREKEIERMQSEVRRLIDALSARSIDERDEAQKALLRIGGPAIALLEKARPSPDPEVQTRVEAILKRLQDSGVLRRPVSDVLKMGRTILHGWLETDEIEATSKYGSFRASLRHISLISLSEPVEEIAAPVIRLRSGEIVEGDPREAVLTIETEFGTLKVPLKDVVSFKYDEERKHWTVKTERALLTGKVTGDRLQLQTPAGSIAVPLSEMEEFGR